jgi:hypothetical protein
VILQISAFLSGFLLVLATLYSAIETFVLPRGEPSILTRLVFELVRRLFLLRLRGRESYELRDRVMAFYAPVTLLLLLPVWLALVSFGYMGMFWALDGGSWYQAFRVSGSSLLTLGFERAEGIAQTILAFTEATIGLMLVALLIAYLPTMYAAFSRREAAVTLLEVRAGRPPSALDMIEWEGWEAWFADVEESHTSLAALVFFRSPQPAHSWVTSAGTVLNAASLTLAAVDIPHDPRADLCIRAGYLALRRICDYFGIVYNPDPSFPKDPISISRQEFEAALDRLAENDCPIKEDREQAWLDFAGWRVNYDVVLLALADLTNAPEAPWTSDRKVEYHRRSLIRWQ